MSFERQEQALPSPYHVAEDEHEDETMTNQYNPAGLPVPTDHDLKQVHSSPSTGSARRMLQRRKKRKDDSLSDVIRSWLVEHQIGMLIFLPIPLPPPHASRSKQASHTKTLSLTPPHHHHQASPSTSSSSTPSPISSSPACAPAPEPSSASPTTIPMRARTVADQMISTLSHTGLSSSRD